VNNPFFWLGLSILLVAISLMALLVVAVFTLQELARAARSAEKLLDTLNREMPATLQDLRLTGKEIAVLSDEVSGGMQSARSVANQVDQGLLEAKAHAQKAQVTTRSFMAGATAALRVLTGKPRRRRSRPPTRRPPVEIAQQPAAKPAQRPAAKPAQQPPAKPSEPSSPVVARPVVARTATDADQAKQPTHNQKPQPTEDTSPAPQPSQPTRHTHPQKPESNSLSDTISPAISESTPRKQAKVSTPKNT